MADETVIFKYEIQGETKYVNSLKEAKKAQKELFSEALNGSEKAKKAYADLKDKLEDVTEEANTLKGSGVEKLTSSFGLLSQGITNFDTGKITAGFKGIGAAMGAIPIFLLIQGIQLLIENFDVVIDFVKDFVGVTNDSEDAAKRATDAINGESEALKGLIDASNEITKTELLNAKLRGESEEQLAERTRLSIQNRIRYSQEAVEQLVKEYNQIITNDEATDEQLKNATEKLNAARDIKKKSENDLVNFDIQSKLDQRKRDEDADKEALAKLKERNEKIKAEKAKQAAEDNAVFAQSLADEQVIIDADRKLIEDKQKERDTNRLAGIKLVADEEKAYRDQAVKEAEENAAKGLDLAKETADAKVKLSQNEFAAAKGLSDLFFQVQLNGAKGNSAKLLEIAKKKFIVDKAFAAAQATQEGIRGVQGIFASTAPYGPEVQIPATIAAGVLAAANVAKILAVKFDAGAAGAGGGASDSTSGGGGNTVSPPPAPPQFSNQNQNQTIIQTNGSTQPLQAVLVETQSRRVEDRVNKIESQSSF